MMPSNLLISIQWKPAQLAITKIIRTILHTNSGPITVIPIVEEVIIAEAVEVEIIAVAIIKEMTVAVAILVNVVITRADPTEVEIGHAVAVGMAAITNSQPPIPIPSQVIPIVGTQKTALHQN
jgi:hypothetical protein